MHCQYVHEEDKIEKSDNSHLFYLSVLCIPF